MVNDNDPVAGNSSITASPASTSTSRLNVPPAPAQQATEHPQPPPTQTPAAGPSAVAATAAPAEAGAMQWGQMRSLGAAQKGVGSLRQGLQPTVDESDDVPPVVASGAPDLSGGRRAGHDAAPSQRTARPHTAVPEAQAGSRIPKPSCDAHVSGASPMSSSHAESRGVAEVSPAKSSGRPDARRRQRIDFWLGDECPGSVEDILRASSGDESAAMSAAATDSLVILSSAHSPGTAAQGWPHQCIEADLNH